LGCNAKGEEDVRTHPFFRRIDWLKIESREVQPPFKPKIKHRKDVSNFDKQFTSEKLDLTPTDKLFMMNLDQNEFFGFSFPSPDQREPGCEDALSLVRKGSVTIMRD